MLDSGGYAMPGDSFGPLVSAVGGWASENDYALGSGEIVSGPTLASVPAGSNLPAGSACSAGAAGVADAPEADHGGAA
jgi:hypothetical protein